MAKGGLAPAARVQPMNSFSNIGYDSNKVNLPRYSLKEGAYWSLLSYSRLRFDVFIPSGKTQWYSLFINLQSQDDPYQRTFRVFLNGNQRYSTTIGPPGFSTTLSAGTMLWITGTQTVELEIQWGFYSQTGWKLIELYPINNEFPNIQNPDPTRIRDWTGEWFPKTDSVSPLTWQAKLGTDSKVDVNIQQGNDPYTRCLRVYVDGTMKTGECDYTVPGHFIISLGTYAQGVHWLKLEIKWGFYTEFGWKIDLSNFRVDYAAMSVQADYMPGMAPIQDALNYIQTYYSDHGPERVTFFVTNQVAETRFLTANAYFNNYVNANPSTYLHNGDTCWNYVIFGEYASDDGTSANSAVGYSFGGGAPGQTSPFFFIAEQQIRDCIGNFLCTLWPASETAAQKSITMHEFGHDVGMIHNPSWLNSDIYAVAVNGQSVRDSPVYAIGDWVNRVFP
jgi:hypothetical protein